MERYPFSPRFSHFGGKSGKESGKKWGKVGKSGKNVGKMWEKWENFFFFSRSTVTRQPRSCSERGPSARFCQKINFKYFFPLSPPLFPPFSPPLFPTFSHFFPHFFPLSPLFSPLSPLFSPVSGGQNSKKTGGSDLNPAPAMQFAVMHGVFHNVGPPVQHLRTRNCQESGQAKQRKAQGNGQTRISCGLDGPGGRPRFLPCTTLSSCSWNPSTEHCQSSVSGLKTNAETKNPPCTEIHTETRKRTIITKALQP